MLKNTENDQPPMNPDQHRLKLLIRVVPKSRPGHRSKRAQPPPFPGLKAGVVGPTEAIFMFYGWSARPCGVHLRSSAAHFLFSAAC
jgi:hypothetical protein